MTQQGPIIFNGRYELHSRLGRGGMAEVYLARDQMLDRPVAVKVLFPALATDPGFVERFRREAQAAAALNHPNIVGVYDWGEANGTYFIVMEYVEGESLAELIHAEGRIHPDRAAEIAGDMASALGFAHRNGGVIHRDVKPGNVLITKDGDVKVADFGIARAISDSSDTNLTKTGSVMGTATYFSPEQARGAAIDPRSDVYSLGCVLYEMIIGRPPFSGENAVAIAYKHVQEPAPSPRQADPAVPDTLEAIILKCLAKNPDNRYPSAQDLRADLRRYLDGARIVAEPVMAGPPQGATGVMPSTGYMQPTSAMGQPYGDGYGYGSPYGDEFPDEEEPRSKAPLIILILLVVLLLGLLLWWALSSSGGGGTTEVEVPELVGMSYDEAEEELESLGLEATRTNLNDPAQLAVFGVSEDAVDEGDVVGQDPDQGQMLAEGESVELSVWAGTETVTIPDLEGDPQEEAREELDDLGLAATTKFEENDEIEPDHVIRTEPPAGEEVPADELITMFVSEGEGQVTVPNVVGKPQGQAEAEIAGAGLGVGEVTPEASNDVPDGTVIRTSPPGNSQVDAGSQVSLVISSGPEETLSTVPGVMGLDESAAVASINNQGLSPNKQTTTVTDPGQDGKVVNQTPGEGEQVPEGSEVVIVVGVYEDPGDGGGGGDGGGIFPSPDG